MGSHPKRGKAIRVSIDNSPGQVTRCTVATTIYGAANPTDNLRQYQTRHYQVGNVPELELTELAVNPDTQGGP